MQTLLGQLKLGLLGGELRQLPPLLLTGRLLGQAVTDLKVAKLDSKVKLVFRILNKKMFCFVIELKKPLLTNTNSKSLFFKALFL